MNTVIRVLVSSDSHANLDSLPLRFGIHFLTDTVVELLDCKDLGADERYADRRHYEARIEDPNDPVAPPQIGHFVLGDRYQKGEWTLVTVWRNDVDSEYFLSQTLRQLREDNFLSPEILLKIHPYYRKGQVNSSAALIRFMSQQLARVEIARLEASERTAHQKAELALAELAQAKSDAAKATADAARARGITLEAIEAVEELTETNQRLDEENRLLKLREQQRFEEEKLRASQERSVATLSASDILMSVEENVLFKGSRCTILTFGDKSTRHMKTATFDPDGQITAKAQTLVGKRVRTTCWDPLKEPGKWSSQGYFRNVFQLD